jgi:hypothetical protein
LRPASTESATASSRLAVMKRVDRLSRSTMAAAAWRRVMTAGLLSGAAAAALMSALVGQPRAPKVLDPHLDDADMHLVKSRFVV